MPPRRQISGQYGATASQSPRMLFGLGASGAWIGNLSSLCPISLISSPLLADG
jgi:hypothetical protein